MRCAPQSGRGPLTNPGWCGGSVGGIYSLRILLGHLATPDQRQHPDFPVVSRFGPSRWHAICWKYMKCPGDQLQRVKRRRNGGHARACWTTSFGNALVVVTLTADTNNVAQANSVFPGVDG